MKIAAAKIIGTVPTAVICNSSLWTGLYDTTGFLST